MSPEEIESWFPSLKQEGWKPTSEETEEYNCIAWAADDMTRKWDPETTGGRYWPNDVPRNLELMTFVSLFGQLGYLPCGFNSDLEAGFEKVAIYCNYNPQLQAIEVTHAAKQLPSGKWTSKLGNVDDIEHNTLTALGGAWPAYGTVKQIMKRPANR